MLRSVHRLAWVLLLPLIGLMQACSPEASAPATSAPAEIAVGSRAPAFTLPDALTGRNVSLSDYNQPVLLYFHMAVG